MGVPYLPQFPPDFRAGHGVGQFQLGFVFHACEVAVFVIFFDSLVVKSK